MIINELMYKNKLSKYKLSKISKIPYSTIEDIFSMKTDIKNLTLSNSIKLSKAFNINVEDVVRLQDNTDADVFRSSICHRVKNLGDLSFIKQTILSNEIVDLFKYNLYFESLYLLSMLDYISNKNSIPLVKDYDYIRNTKLEYTYYPKSLLCFNNKKLLKKEFDNSISEFKLHNIVESDVYNVA